MSRWVLGAVFLAAYAISSLTAFPLGQAVFVSIGAVLYLLSVPWATGFHKIFALISFLVLGTTVFTGRFDATDFVEDLFPYFNVVAVLLVLSVAGYPIRAARYEVQIRTLLTQMARRGVRPKTVVGGLAHLLGTVLDVGALVLMDVVGRRTIPSERVDSLVWAARAFAFAPLWSNLNLLTVITIELAGVSYLTLLIVALPYVVLGLGVTLFLTQREKSVVESPAEGRLDRGAAAVLAYPVLLVAAVAFINHLHPETSLTVMLALTVGAIVLLIAGLAAALARKSSPVRRLATETRASLVGSHAEFTLFGSAGILVICLTQLGALTPIGSFFTSLATPLVVPALAVAIALGFLVGIHSIPMVLLINAAFPLSESGMPVLWVLAILVGNGAGMLLTPFSNTTAMLSRLTGVHPLEVGPGRNWKFAFLFGAAGMVYLVLVDLLF